jgi:ribosome-binding factor A
MSHRIKRINELIKQELGKIFLKELDFAQGVLITITKVDTSRDLYWADVWISIYPSEAKEINFKKLKRSIGHFQFLLNKNLSLKILPRLRFSLDETEDKVKRIEDLLDKNESKV